jgi:hypothetical protein
VGARRWWSGEAWTEYIDDGAVATTVRASSSSSEGRRRRTPRFAVVALAIASLALAGAAVIHVVASSGAGEAATTKSTPAKSASRTSVAAASVTSTPCRIIPRSSKFAWSGPPLSTFSGVAVPGSGRSAGAEVCETQANGILYHVDISPVALSAPNKQIDGTTRIEFGHTTAFVSEQTDFASWLFEDGIYSGEVFFQAVGPPTAAYPTHADTENLIRLLLATASKS